MKVRIAFIGLGKMGGGMASRLLEAGHRVSVYNRTTAKADSLVSRGARLAGSPKEACVGAEAVFCMVSDDAASRAIWLGADGVLAAELAPGTLAIECSTLSHGWVMDLAAGVASRGLCYIDSPVTGLPADAAGGVLTL
jgi:3-hydroxyisobutyrate dehydrogenase